MVKDLGGLGFLDLFHVLLNFTRRGAEDSLGDVLWSIENWRGKVILDRPSPGTGRRLRGIAGV